MNLAKTVDLITEKIKTKPMLWFLRGRPRRRPKTFQGLCREAGDVKPRPTAAFVGKGEILMFRDREVQVQRRAYKRSIGLTLQVNGRIRVSAPKSTPMSRIREFLLANTEWIETNLQRYKSLRETYPPKEYKEGERFLYLGEELVLTFRQGRHSKPRFHALDGQLIAEIPPLQWDSFRALEPHPELSTSLLEFYSKSARSIIGARLEFYSNRMGLRPSSVSFRSQKTRWGSCSVRGRISLNWRLIVAPRDVIDYVVVHELSHLKHYNHSAAFWNLVASQLPNYASLRSWLRQHQYEADFLAKKSELHDV